SSLVTRRGGRRAVGGQGLSERVDAQVLVLGDRLQVGRELLRKRGGVREVVVLARRERRFERRRRAFAYVGEHVAATQRLRGARDDGAARRIVDDERRALRIRGPGA